MTCDHADVVYEMTTRTVRPYRWSVHTFSCTTCDVKAVVVDREKVKGR